MEPEGPVIKEKCFVPYLLLVYLQLDKKNDSINSNNLI